MDFFEIEYTSSINVKQNLSNEIEKTLSHDDENFDKGFQTQIHLIASLQGKIKTNN